MDPSAKMNSVSAMTNVSRVVLLRYRLEMLSIIKATAPFNAHLVYPNAKLAEWTKISAKLNGISAIPTA